MKKLTFIIPLMILLAAACQRQAVIKLSPEGIKPSSQATSTMGQKPAPAKKPDAVANPTKQNPEGAQSYSNIQNNSTVIQNSSSSNYTNIHNNSTVIQNTSSGNSSSINLKIDSSSFPKATVGQAFSTTITFQQSGNNQILAEVSGLPPGLGLSVAGSSALISSTTLTNPGQTPSLTLAGTPGTAGDYNVTIKLNNKQGTVISSQFTLVINP